eukprot:jgi/Undpi1/5928/HiC_scaffold_2.g01202.m1
MSTDQFNFVGLTRSPVKRTPQTGYYDGEGHRTNTKREPVSAATTERMSVGSINSAGSTDPRRRRTLHPVPANTLEASHTPSSVALLLSSISSKRAALSARRSTLPVPRTLQLSPADSTRPDPTSTSERGDCASRCSGSSSSQHHFLRDGDGRHHSPPSYTGGSATAQHHQPPTPAMVTDPYPTPSRASHVERSYDANDDGGGREWSSDCSFTDGAVFSPDPTSLSVEPVHRSGGVSGTGGGSGGGSGSWRSSRRGDRSAMVSPISNIYSASKIGGSALRGIGEATPRCPETRGASPFEGTMNSFGESSSTCTPVGGSGPALLRVGGNRSPVVAESVAASSSSASRYAARGGATPASAAAINSSSNAGRYAARDRATPGAVEREEEELPDAPAAAATLAGMMMGRGDVADSLCGTVDEEQSFLEGEGEEEEEEEEEEGGFLAEGSSEGSADAQVDARSTAPKSPLKTSTMNSSRSAMTPRRPRSAMALLDISAETPRRMIRGIIGGASLVGMAWKQQRPQQEQRFVPKVSKVTETEIVEEDTPRRFILGMLASSEKKVASERDGLNGGRIFPPSDALVGASASCSSSSSAAAAVAVAAAATTAAASSPVASSSPAAAVAVAALPRARERSGRAVQDDDTGVSNNGGTAVQRTIAIQTSTAAVPVDVAPSAAALPHNGTVVDHGSASGGGKGRRIIKAGLGLSAVVGFCVIALGVFVLACLAFSKPALTVPIY